MRRLLPALTLSAALVLAGCGDDDGAGAEPAEDGAGTVPATIAEVPGGTAVGPTEGGAACADLADRYVRRARVLFTQEGTPPDALVDETRARLAEFDEIAVAAGCGPEYTTGVCDGLDAMAQEGILVIYPLVTAQCL